MKLIETYRWYKKGTGFVNINHYIDSKGNSVHKEMR